MRQRWPRRHRPVSPRSRADGGGAGVVMRGGDRPHCSGRSRP
jgi:hypothetical protein